ncbi:alkylation response protein AidB-like acyl-CoA dehydrogenase [Pseudomonas duriflava]|uniref:Alkylation response protein AidB-like acyl-CoA dehydrogenase n=1 Tax=Pseudomonas duriflava TaxID=459528 RepID=A0A562Q6X8_9PSED|nr:acyl-CoA dehydrogenase family protein [Pseudomonas duriflava]TWI52483.1 alkylation response protein AidB-like acyl-CoA dehydrogenase [Pseudomonas duriflava]
MDLDFSPKLVALKATVDNVIEHHIAPLASRVDQEALWPAHSMKALAEAGLMGLQVPVAQGGHGQGLLALAVMTEAISKACPSSALCFGMHCVGTAVIAAKATPYQQEHYLQAIAAGKHLTTLALSESGSGAHFYVPATRIDMNGQFFTVTGVKQFVTNGGQADSYVLSTVASGEESESGDFNCLIVDGQAEGLQWQAPWNGFGMRGNSSCALKLDGVQVPMSNLLGEPGDQVWYVFEVVAPFFLMAMAGTYLGIAQAALDAAGEQLRARHYEHSGETLREIETLQTRYASMWIALEKTRSLVREAARRGDRGDPDALPFILACKADAGETAVMLANEAMTLCGGAAYRENSRVAQMLRDARASHVMSPTTDLLKLWTGRCLLGLPLL